MKNKKLISLVVVFVFIFSFINYIKLDTNTFAKNINNYSCDYYESYEPTEVCKNVREIFSKYNIDNDDNLLMVGCNKDYILDFSLAGNAIGVVRDLAFGGYYICYGNEEDLEYAKTLLESDPNIEYAEKNEILYLEDDLDTNEVNANLLTNEESDLDINEDEVLKDIKIREYIDKIDDIFKTRKVKVGIISSGIYKDHELFQGVIEGVYKLYNKKLDRHLFTTEGEAKKLEKSGWEVKNGGEPVFYSCGDIKIYRLYNPNDGDHLLTTSINELGKLVKLGWECKDNVTDTDIDILYTIRTKEKK